MISRIKKSLIIVGMAVSGSFLLSSCIPMGDAPVSGSLFQSVKYPGKPYSEAKVSKTSEEFCARSFLGLVAVGDASVQTAASSVGITKVAYIDKKRTSILSTSTVSQCTQVSGE